MPVERASPRPRCLAPVIGPSLKKQKGARKPPSRYFPQTGRVAATADRGPGGASCSELALRGHSLRFQVPPMPRLVKRSASQAITSGPSRRGVPLPQFVLPQLSQPVEKPPSGPQWLHEIKLDGYRMAARIDNGRVQ